jgi:hypothetical protein
MIDVDELDRELDRVERILKTRLTPPQSPPPPPTDDGGRQPHNDDMEPRIAALEARLDTLVPTLATKGDLAELKTEMHKGFADMIKWIVGSALAGIAVFITVMTFVLNNAVPKTPTAPQMATPPPIIINVPGAQPAPVSPTK